MKNIVMLGHGGFGNRGCEAIVRSTSMMLKEFLTCRVILASYEYLQDKTLYPKETFVDEYLNHFNEHKSLNWLKAAVARRMLSGHYNKYDLLWLRQSAVLKTGNLFLSVGGDNYCSPDPEYFYLMNKVVRAAGKKLVLWGASVEPLCVNQRMYEDLAGFDLICVRESLSYHGLLALGLKNVRLFADPAFALVPQETAIPRGFVRGKTIGLNFSPLIEKHEPEQGIVRKTINSLIEHILDTTDQTIALFPHVVQDIPGQNDLAILQEVFDKYADTNRVLLVDYRLNACELKYLIGECSAFVGARTHSTIAAYSSLVPTLTLGYSIKARGIALDLLGDEHFVVPVQNLTNVDAFIELFDELFNNRAGIHERLAKVVPAEIELAHAAVRKICGML